MERHARGKVGSDLEQEENLDSPFLKSAGHDWPYWKNSFGGGFEVFYFLTGGPMFAWFRRWRGKRRVAAFYRDIKKAVRQYYLYPYGHGFENKSFCDLQKEFGPSLTEYLREQKEKKDRQDTLETAATFLLKDQQ